AAALGAIKKYEPFCRGWFGGPVGWIQGNQAEFAVGIRSALCIAQNQINLYAGVGIVAGSEANAEWAEMNQKLRVWEGSLGL
ncbi:MAG TPA: isochorismate synthase MenF, partial [Candidatus Marinimicrobia bacterium]|nr:isochorismate synthase MenF [Candidatus Neomarinimicrobiota bacterium]